jgi:hypothetical protein
LSNPETTPTQFQPPPRRDPLSNLAATNASIGALILGTPLPVSSGGTGWNALAAGFVPFGNGTGAIATSSNLSFSGTTLTAPLADKGGQVFNVKAYGAKGDGVTDDTAAITAAITAASSGGQLYFPPGNYITNTCGFTISTPIDVVGAGQPSKDLSQYGSVITCTSPTAVLFTVTAKVASFQNIGLLNTAPSPSAGAAVFVNGTYYAQMVNFDAITVSGFYDDIHVGVGSAWTLSESRIQNPVRYGIYIQNTVNPDWGDWVLAGNYFESSKTGSVAAINIESSGGGKIFGNKINTAFTNGILINASGSEQTLIAQNDIENTSGASINIVQGWPYIVIVSNYLNSPVGFPAISATGLDGFTIADNDLETGGSNSTAAIVITNSVYGTIGTNHVNSYFTTTTSLTSVTQTTDLSTLAVNNPVFTGTLSVNNSQAAFFGCNHSGAGCGDDFVLTLGTYFSGAQTSTIQSSFSGDGLTLTPPRDYSGKGLYVRSQSGTARLYVSTYNGTVQTTNNTLDDGSGNATFTGAALSIGCSTSGCGQAPQVNFNGMYGSTPFSASIQASWSGNGLTFTAPRDLAGKGFYFNSLAGTTRMFIDTGNGNVGIGTTTPWGRLSVSGADLSSVTPSFVAADINNKPLFNVMDNGNVGIGTMSPGNTLDIRNAAADYQLRLGSSINADYFDMGRDNSTGAFWLQGNQVGNNNIVLAPTSGNVGIGTNNPYSRLQITGPDTASTSVFAVVNSASTTEFTVYDTGNATLAGSLVQNSDERLKTDIQDLDGSSSLAEINALNPVTFNWIDPSKNSVPQFGFIAQQVQSVFPNLVSTTSPTALTPDGTLSLDYIDLISPIVAAIQELDKEITLLASTVAGFAQSITSAVGNFGQVNTQQLCVSDTDGTTCVTRSQLAAVLAAANQSASASASPSPSTSAATDTLPVITINGDNPAIIQVGATYSDLGATITAPLADLNLGIKTFLNGALVGNIVIDTSAAATDTIAYVVTDPQGITSTSTRTVVIQPANDNQSSVSANDNNASTTFATSTAQ